MRNIFIALAVSTFLLFPSGVELRAQDAKPAEGEKKAEAPKEPATVTAKDGSIVRGDVVEMIDGNLNMQTRFGDKVPVKWSEVQGLRSEQPIKVKLKDTTTVIEGTVEPGPAGKLIIRSGQVAQPVEVAMDSIEAINPPPKKAITYKGNLSFGGSVSDGNTNTKSATLQGDFEMRGELSRFTMRGSTNYQETEDEITQRNSKGTLKYDFFFWKRFFAFASAFFEGDKFQDLNLRTALSAGVGYQIFDKGMFESEWLKELQSYAEFGVAYFDEDFRRAEDQNYVSGRWSFKIDWPIVPKKITLFHFDEGFPSFERGKDIYITTEQGVRLTLPYNFFLTAQVNWRWDNTPSAGFERSDTLYLMNLGVGFEL